MRKFELFIRPLSIECTEVESKRCKCRLFASGAGLEFYTKGITSGRVDQLANIVMNKAIEVNGTIKGVTLVRVAKAPFKPNPNQRKLI